MAKAQMSSVDFKARRDIFFSQIEGSVAIIPANSESIRNNTVIYKFRQDSMFYYLTGFEEPDAVAVFRNVKGKKEYILFVRPRDPEKEMWDGYRAGVEGAVQKFKADRAYPVEELTVRFRELLEGTNSLYYTLIKRLDLQIMHMLDDYKKSLGRTGCGYLPIKDVYEVIGEMRIRKDAIETQRIREAARLSVFAHKEVMTRCRPGLQEYQIEALVEYAFRNQGAGRIGYSSIVASGSNATILHYVENNCELRGGDLLLIDAGGEFEYYTADITRTYPVIGKFTPEQNEIYSIVLAAQKACIAMAKPGVTLTDIHTFAVEQLTDAMIKLGFLSGDKDTLIKTQAFKRFYPHGTGHLLGMDVHDVGLYHVNGDARKLEPGMVFTVEPGFYIQPHDTSVPEKYRGIGVRIEDDVLITSTGHEVLTAGAPKEVKDLEALVGTKPWLELN